MSPDAKVKFERFWELHKDKPWAGREKILDCMCPQIHGMPFVKLATLIMLIGGVPRVDDSGTSIRGQVHMLIVGDPGTGTESFFGRKEIHRLHDVVLLESMQDQVDSM